MHGKHISYKTQKPFYRLMRVEVENEQFAFDIEKNSWVEGFSTTLKWVFL